MNEQTLSPAIEKALADLRAAISAELSNKSSSTIDFAPSAPVSPAPEVNPIAAAPITTPAPETAAVTFPTIAPVENNISSVAPATDMSANINLSDTSTVQNNITDLSGVGPEVEAPISANNGLDDSAPLTPVTPTLDTPVADLTAAPAQPAMSIPEVNPTASVQTEIPLPTPTAPQMNTAPATGGLPKANSLLSSVLKKGWTSSQQ